MKTGCLTINQVIGLLEKARKERGGSARVMLYDRCGEKIKPVRMEEGMTNRSGQTFEWLAFTEDL